MVDLSKLQEITDDLFKIAGIPSSILTMDGELLTLSGWQRICIDFHRQNPHTQKECIQSDVKLRKISNTQDDFVIYKCPRGLVDGSSPVIIAGEHVANILSGQIFLEPPGKIQEEFFREQARTFGFDELSYMEAFREIPVVTEDKFRSFLSFLAKLAQIIAQMSFIRHRELESGKKLKESEGRFKSLFEESGDAALLHRDGRFTDCNQAVVNMFRMGSKEQVLNCTPADISSEFQPDGRRSDDKYIEMDKLAYIQGNHRFEWTCKRANDEEFTVEVMLTSIKMNEVPFSHALLRDITENKLAQEAVRKTSRALRLLSETNRIIGRAKNELHILNHICRLLVLNGNYRFAWIGYADQDKKKTVRPIARYGFGQEFLDNLHITWADTKWGRGPAGRSIRECKPIICRKISSDPYFIPWKKLAKEQGFLSGIALPLVFRNQVFGSLSIYASEEDAFGAEEAKLLEELANDIAHGIMAIRAQENLRQAEKVLRTEHEKLQSVLNAIGDNLYIVNKDYLIEFQNMVSKETFGKLTGKKCYQGIFQRNKPCEFCLMQKTLNENRIHQLETTPLNQKQYDVVFSPFQEADGVMKAIVVIRDITEKKYIQAEALCADRLASLGELAAGVAHEINNPATSIISLAEILTDKFHKLGGDKKIPERIIHEGERIGNIVKNLLSFARNKKEEHSPVHIKDILQSAFELVERQIHKDGIHLSVNIPSDLPKIKARSQEIQQVFLNIISNARYALKAKYTGFHENKILEIIGELIKIGKNEYVRLTFYDRGTGIAPNHIDRVADPFFSTKPHGEGTGLGLSISHGIIKAHGGNLRFESQSDEYTKVMIDLPINSEWASRAKYEIQDSCS